MFRILYRIRTQAVPVTISTKYLSQSSNSVIVETRNGDEGVNQNIRISREPNKSISWDEAKPFESIPGPKPLPIIGNTWRFLPIIGEYYGLLPKQQHAVWRKQFGDILVIRNIKENNAMVFTFNADDSEMIFRTEGIWPERDSVHSLVMTRKLYSDWASPGLLALDGEEWGKVRSVVNTVLMKPQSIKKYIPQMVKVADDFIKNVDKLVEKSPELPKDFDNEINKWALESIALVSLDRRLGCLEPNLPADSEAQQTINCVTEMFDLVYKLDILPSMYKYVSTKDWRRLVEVLDFLTGVWRKHIDSVKERLKHKDLSASKDLSITEQLLLKDEYIAYGMAIDMLNAGIDTTAKTVGAGLYYLAINQDVQEKLRQEIFKVLPDHSATLSEKSIESMPYLKAVIKETQRLAPIGIGSIRKTKKNIVLSGYQIPKGTRVVACNLLMCSFDKNFIEPEKFMPERWMRGCPIEISSKNANPFVYLPFGYGPRSCVGKRLALNEIEIFLIQMLRNYKFEWKREPMIFSSKLLYGVESPLKFTLTKINNN